MTTGEIAKFLNAVLEGSSDVQITNVSSLDRAAPNSISFIDNEKSFDAAAASTAGCIIVPKNFDRRCDTVLIKAEKPKVSFARIAAVLNAKDKEKAVISPASEISPAAIIGKNVSVGAFTVISDGAEIGEGSVIGSGCFIGENVKIGHDCRIHSRVTIESGCDIGDRCILHSGVVIGADGFGFVRDDDGYVKFPQIGTVILENEVEIGANSCIDRGSLGDTLIGEGTKIDNLVQIAHNVRIGRRVVIAAQTGISGSTVIEDDCVIGGQVGMGDHATVKSGAVIGSQAGVLPGKIVRAGVWWGTPVQPLDEYKRQNAMVKGLSRLRDEIKELKKKIGQ